ncbi:MAG TPA: ligase-associated DNA damage response exonuclease [Bdellovibrionota bacterium]|nr:ligase-associated DNA damage response exonuclease [Bdellovibrionota bacterium]
MRFAPIFELNERGLYCAAGDFYIDPVRGVDRAVVTHAHSDHARRGSGEYFCVLSGEGLLRVRLGKRIRVRTVAYGETFALGSARLSFHPAGHVLGSSQVRVEVNGKVWVVTGDYKRESDPSCEPFEVVPCDVLVTEATFGTPAFCWRRELSIGEEIHTWWRENASRGVTSVVLGYSIGKSQRILAELLPWMKAEPVWIHTTLHEATECYRREGIALAETRVIDDAAIASGELRGSLLLAPPSYAGSEELARQVGPLETAFASGWMSGKGRWQGRAPQKGFVISDHADWPALLRTVEECGAKEVYVMQRGRGALVRHLRASGLSADSIEALRSKSGADPQQLKLFS